MGILISAVIGVVLGIIGAKFIFVGSYLSLIPWSVVSFLIGYFTKGYKNVVINGAVFGFVLSFVFMLVGYTGTRPVWTVAPFFLLLGLCGAFCGAVIAYVGKYSKNLIKKPNKL